MIAFLYAGQGSQEPGMGADFYRTMRKHRPLYDAREEMRDISFHGPAEALNQTIVAQPALVAHEILATDALLAAGLRPEATAGLSLGQYSALYAAAVFSAEHCLRLIDVRAAAMQKACQERVGEMVAVIGLSREKVMAICAQAEQVSGEVVRLANDNAPAQQVIGGTPAAVAAAKALLKEAGARRLLPLSVSGAFHTPLMETAKAPLARALAETPLSPPSVPVYSNVTAAPLAYSEIGDDLIRQLVSPVRLVESIEQMLADGVTVFVEIGPGKVLSGLVRRIAGKDFPCYSVVREDDIAAVCADLALK